MSSLRLIGRVLTPGFLVSLAAALKYRSFVSPRAEVELSSNLTMGRGCQIGAFTKVKTADGPLSLGDKIHIASNCFLSSGSGGIFLGDGVGVGPSVSIVGNNYQYDRLDQAIIAQPKTSVGIKVGRFSWLGAGAVILDGAEVGQGVIVFPNSVVQGAVPDFAIVQGNPAQVVFKRR